MKGGNFSKHSTHSNKYVSYWQTNTHTHTHSLSRTLTNEHRYHASPGISIPSFPSSVNRTCPKQILHSTPTHQMRSMLSTEHLSANTISGISENSRTCQTIESDIELLLGKKNKKTFFTPLFKNPHAPCSMSTRRRSGVTFICGLYIEINMKGISSNDQFTTSVHLLYS